LARTNQTEVVVLSKDELKDIIREVPGELNIEHYPSRGGFMNAAQASGYLGVSRSFLQASKKQGLMVVAKKLKD